VRATPPLVSVCIAWWARVIGLLLTGIHRWQTGAAQLSIEKDILPFCAIFWLLYKAPSLCVDLHGFCVKQTILQQFELQKIIPNSHVSTQNTLLHHIIELRLLRLLFTCLFDEHYCSTDAYTSLLLQPDATASKHLKTLTRIVNLLASICTSSKLTDDGPVLPSTTGEKICRLAPEVLSPGGTAPHHLLKVSCARLCIECIDLLPMGHCLLCVSPRSILTFNTSDKLLVGVQCTTRCFRFGGWTSKTGTGLTLYLLELSTGVTPSGLCHSYLLCPGC
jgi:hypothetical protein